MFSLFFYVSEVPIVAILDVYIWFSVRNNSGKEKKKSLKRPLVHILPAFVQAK